MSAKVVNTELPTPCRVGLVADTHGGIVDWAGIQPQLAPIFTGVDLILHCGDVGNYEVLDALSQVAPVLAVRSEADPPERRSDLVDGTRVIDCGGIRVGLTFSLTAPPVAASADGRLAFPSEPPERVGELLFGGPVDVVVFGGTHQDLVARAGGVLFVNPGSPSLAERTTAGLLEIADGVVQVQIRPVGNDAAIAPTERDQPAT